MSLQDLEYIPSEGDRRQQKATSIEIQNPCHPDVFTYVDEGLQKEYFEAALWLKNEAGPGRHRLVSDFIMCLRQLEENDNSGPMRELINQLER